MFQTLAKLAGLFVCVMLVTSLWFNRIKVQDSAIQPPINKFTYGVAIDDEPLPSGIELVSGPAGVAKIQLG